MAQVQGSIALKIAKANPGWYTRCETHIKSSFWKTNGGVGTNATWVIAESEKVKFASAQGPGVFSPISMDVGGV